MRTPGPTAGSAHAGRKFGNSFFNTNLPSLHFLAGGNPANPFVASKWGDIFPQGQQLGFRDDNFFKVTRKTMHCAGGNFLIHKSIVYKKTAVRLCYWAVFIYYTLSSLLCS